MKKGNGGRGGNQKCFVLIRQYLSPINSRYISPSGDGSNAMWDGTVWFSTSEKYFDEFSEIPRMAGWDRLILIHS
jgi:hypothetical protein